MHDSALVQILLVLTTLDLEDVPLELVADILTIHLRSQPLVVERAQLLVIVDLDELLYRVPCGVGQPVDERILHIQSLRRSKQELELLRIVQYN